MICPMFVIFSKVVSRVKRFLLLVLTNHLGECMSFGFCKWHLLVRPPSNRFFVRSRSLRFGRRQTGPGAPKMLSDLACLRDYLASPTPPKKSSKNAIVYGERLLEMEQVRYFFCRLAFFVKTHEREMMQC